MGEDASDEDAPVVLSDVTAVAAVDEVKADELEDASDAMSDASGAADEDWVEVFGSSSPWHSSSALPTSMRWRCRCSRCLRSSLAHWNGLLPRMTSALSPTLRLRRHWDPSIQWEGL